MGLIEELTEAGVDMDDALKRFMGNSALFERLIKKLPENVKKYDVAESFEKKDYENALSGAHSLKGTMGNLSVKTLFDGYTKIVNFLRANQNEEAEEVFKEILPAQENIISIIEKYI